MKPPPVDLVSAGKTTDEVTVNEFPARLHGCCMHVEIYMLFYYTAALESTLRHERTIANQHRIVIHPKAA